MAALIVRKNIKTILKSSIYLHSVKRTNYYFLLPEIPPDTPETNPILCSNTPIPFKKVTPKQFYNATFKRCLEFENSLCTLEEELLDGKKAKDFSSILEPLDSLNHQLDSTWNSLKNYYLVNQSDTLAKCYFSLISRYNRTKFLQFDSLTLFYAVKELEADKAHLTEPQRRLVQKYLLECRAGGLELSEKDRRILTDLFRKISTHKQKISENLDYATEKFSREIDNPEIIKQFPDQLVKMLAVNKNRPSQGPWFINLHPVAFQLFLQHCSNRDLRRSAYVASISRGWPRSDPHHSVSPEIEEIRQARNTQAKLLGHENFAELSMETKMAENLNTVKQFLTILHEKCKPKVMEELSSLQDFAGSNGADYILDIYDIPYWQQKQRTKLYGVDEMQVSQYFPFPYVLQGLFNIFNKFLDISFKDSTSEVEVWHPDVRYYTIQDLKGNNLGSFYLDPYYRHPHKLNATWLGPGIGKCDALNAIPMVYLNFNFNPPVGSQPSLLTFLQVRDLIHKMGHLLQIVLSQVGYMGVSGVNNIEWDIVEVCPEVLSQWLTTNHTALASLSHHVSTASTLPKELHSNICKAQSHLSNYHILYETYLSELDLELHSNTTFWVDVAKEKWQHYLPFFPLGEKYNHVCQFTDIWIGPYAASYYSKLWTKMVSADLLTAFAEAGFDNEAALKTVFQRFRETYLSQGGGCDPHKMLQNFLGRELSYEAFLKTLTLQEVP